LDAVGLHDDAVAGDLDSPLDFQQVSHLDPLDGHFLVQDPVPDDLDHLPTLGELIEFLELLLLLQVVIGGDEDHQSDGHENGEALDPGRAPLLLLHDGVDDHGEDAGKEQDDEDEVVQRLQGQLPEGLGDDLVLAVVRIGLFPPPDRVGVDALLRVGFQGGVKPFLPSEFFEEIYVFRPSLSGFPIVGDLFEGVYRF
jgi:hypothetical protein